MIDILFLKRPTPIPFQYSGLEYLDWQAKSTVFNELTAALTEMYNAEKKEFSFTAGARNTISSIIKNKLKMTVNVVIEEFGPAVDTGYLLPGHVFNNKQVEQWLDKDYSKISEAFKDLKKNIIKGWADPKTGMLEGDFQNIPFTLMLTPNLPSQMNQELLLKYKTTVPETMAAFILHECGHIYGGLLYASSKVVDNVMIAQATKMYLKESDNVRRTVILKEALSELGALSEVPTDEMTEEEIIIFFNKNIVNRDYRRSLSLGVANMTFEVIADAYASRFGAGHQLIAGLAAFGYASIWDATKIFAITTAVISILFSLPYLPLFILTMVIYLIGYTADVLTPNIYDVPYRRLKTILRDSITEMNTMVYPRSEKIKRVQELRKIDELVEENKSILESTALQRTMGWIINGSDFRKTDFENYTADLVSTRLSLYSQNYFTE